MDDRAVSEIVGFVLVFGIIIATISIVYVAGFSGLDDTRASEQQNNVERAFDVLADNFEDLARGEAPSRATEMKLSDARIETSDNRRIAVNSSSLAQEHTANPVAIAYKSDSDTEIVYESGAVIRTDGDAGLMLREPDFIFDEHHVVVRYIEPRGSGQSVGGSTTILIRGETRDSRVLIRETDLNSPETVTFNITTSPKRAAVWEGYLEGEIDWQQDVCSIEGADGDVVSCEFDINPSGAGSLTVARTRIRVSVG